MAEALTPSAVLEEYDIVGREVPTSVINKMRGRFAALEIEGVGSWKMLCDEVTDLDAKKKIDQDRLYVAQACAEVLSEKIGHVKYRDGISWKDRLIQLETKEDFLHLFAILGIQNNEWQISSWLANNGYTNCI